MIPYIFIVPSSCPICNHALTSRITKYCDSDQKDHEIYYNQIVGQLAYIINFYYNNCAITIYYNDNDKFGTCVNIVYSFDKNETYEYTNSSFITPTTSIMDIYNHIAKLKVFQ